MASLTKKVRFLSDSEVAQLTADYFAALDQEDALNAQRQQLLAKGDGLKPLK